MHFKLDAIIVDRPFSEYLLSQKYSKHIFLIADSCMYISKLVSVESIFRDVHNICLSCCIVQNSRHVRRNKLNNVFFQKLLLITNPQNYIDEICEDDIVFQTKHCTAVPEFSKKN